MVRTTWAGYALPMVLHRLVVVRRIAAAGCFALLSACSMNGGGAQCYAGCLCFRSDENVCKANGCPWSTDGGYCYNGPAPADGGVD